MADTKISALSAGSALGGTEVFPAVQSTSNVKVTATQIQTFANAGTWTGTAVALNKGGTGATTANAARNALNKGTAALTDGATISTDASTGNVFTVTLGGNRTLANPTNLAAGATYMWIITQDGTGSRTLSYGTNFKWVGGAAPTLTTTAGAVDIITAVSPDGTSLYAVCNKAFA